MAAFAKALCRTSAMLALIAEACMRPASAQQKPSFFRTDYGLDYAISATTGLVIADFNNDGKPDFVVGAGYGLDVALGNGDGTFQPFASFIPGGGINAGAILASTVADFDGDGNLDLVLSSVAGVFILPGKGDGTFGQARLITQAPSGVGPLKAVDMNGDGRPDLLQQPAPSVERHRSAE